MWNLPLGLGILCLFLIDPSRSSAPDNKGTVFIIGFMQNHYENNDVELFITTSRTTTVDVRVWSPKWSSPSIDTSFSITSGQVEQLFISNSLRMYETAKASKGIRVDASDEVVVYGVNKEQYSCDAFLAFPVDVLGTEYYAVMHHPTSYAGEIMVVATEDSTSVTFTMTCSVTYSGTTYSSGQQLSVTLDQYDCIQLQTFEDLTGTYISTNRAVAFYSGNRRTKVGSGSSSDHISEQLMPVDTWGKRFATVPIPTRTTGDYFRIVASEANTNVVVNGNIGSSTFSDSFTISSAGGFAFKHYDSQLYALMESDKPIQLVQFVLSQVTEEADPAMIMIPPIEQYAADYVFSTPKYSQGSYTNYFVFIVSDSQRSGLLLDGGSFPSGTTYNSIPGTDLVGGYIIVSEGTHTIRHSSPISVFCGYLFGLAKWESYGLPAGMRMAPVNTVCVPSTTSTGDGVDNDCDGLIDEELCYSTYQGQDEDGDGSIDEDCATPPPIDGNWATWASWGSCSVTCIPTSGSSTGTKSRTRTCTDPAPQYDGEQCVGSGSESTSCTPTSNCPVNGGWSDWSSWGSCSVTCASGIKSRSRSCTNPSPAYGGASCSGDSSESTSCTLSACPIDGNWGSWASWGTCSLTCGGGTHSRSRNCDNPAPANGGSSCSGDSSSSTTCNTHNCPIDGGWTTWGSWGTCTVTCGGGTQDRSRSCTNPSPQYGGASCSGDTTSSQTCNTHNCPIDGGFTTWTSWDTCTVTCGGGSQGRTRSCTNPAPQYGGASCTGDTSQTQDCNTQVCIIDGAWSQWGAWGTCSVTCNGGKQSRARTCTDPAPENGGLDCTGSSSDLGDCNTQACATAAAGQYVQLCPTGWFTCESGGITCIEQAFVCDCSSDCDDGSDESVTYASCSPQLAVYCPSGAGHTRYSWGTLLIVTVIFFVVFRYRN